MKIIIPVILILFVININCHSANDTLVINLKNNQFEKIAVSQINKIQFEDLTGVELSNSVNTGLQIKGNIPNPFNEQTNIEFEIENPGTVQIIIYDNQGNQIRELDCDNCPSGKNSVLWNCRDNLNNRVKNGVYYYEVSYNNEFKFKKMVLVK